MVIQTFGPWMKSLGINYGSCHLPERRGGSAEYVSRWNVFKGPLRSLSYAASGP